MVDPVALTRDLVRCPSVTPAEGGALALLERTLKPLGFAVERVTFSAPGVADVENLYATIGSGHPHIVFAGHTDVVPAGDETAWSSPPFEAAIRDGRVIGRGAVDMKSAIAAFIAATAELLVARGQKFNGAISLLITGDEEGAAINGTVKLLDWALARGVTFDHCVVGEPTSVTTLGDMLKIGRRGSLSGTLTVGGKAGHVAYPHRADNPIPRLVRILSHLQAKPLDRGTAQFQPSNLEFVSVDTGNPVFNVIPAQVKARFNVRFNDTWTAATLREYLLAEVGRVAPQGQWHIDWDPTVADCFVTPPGPFVTLLSDAIADITGQRPELSTSGGTSDARFIKNACPVVELGLVGAGMHQIDESVPVADIIRLGAIYQRLLERYFAKA